MWQVEIEDAVCNRLDKIPNPDKRRIEQAIYDLEDKFDTLDIKKLVGRKGHRLRVGKWRLLLNIDRENRHITVYKLAPRGQAYKD